jgi:methylmalonyl-CoA mutase, N-terminal domain
MSGVSIESLYTERDLSEETNERFRYLLDHGQTGLSTAFDMPSLTGHDSDHPRSLAGQHRQGRGSPTVAF